MSDNVNHPPHYTKGGIECIDAIRAALGARGFIAYCRGCVIKYHWRSPHKGRPQEDHQKAAWYSQKAAEAQAAADAEADEEDRVCRDAAQILVETQKNNGILQTLLTEAKAQIERLRMEREMRGGGRWETGIRNIVTRLWGPGTEFQIADVVHVVEVALQERDETKNKLTVAQAQIEGLESEQARLREELRFKDTEAERNEAGILRLAGVMIPPGKVSCSEDLVSKAIDSFEKLRRIQLELASIQEQKIVLGPPEISRLMVLAGVTNGGE